MLLRLLAHFIDIMLIANLPIDTRPAANGQINRRIFALVIAWAMLFAPSAR